MGQHRPLLVIFVLLENILFRRIRTHIVGVEGKNADHLTITAQSVSAIYLFSRSFLLVILSIICHSLSSFLSSLSFFLSSFLFFLSLFLPFSFFLSFFLSFSLSLSISLEQGFNLFSPSRKPILILSFAVLSSFYHFAQAILKSIVDKIKSISFTIIQIH